MVGWKKTFRTYPQRYVNKMSGYLKTHWSSFKKVFLNPWFQDQDPEHQTFNILKVLHDPTILPLHVPEIQNDINKQQFITDQQKILPNEPLRIAVFRDDLLC